MAANFGAQNGDDLDGMFDGDGNALLDGDGNLVLDGDGNLVLDEDGNFVLDEDGNFLIAPPPKKKRTVRAIYETQEAAQVFGSFEDAAAFLKANHGLTVHSKNTSPFVLCCAVVAGFVAWLMIGVFSAETVGFLPARSASGGFQDARPKGASGSAKKVSLRCKSSSPACVFS